MNIEIHFIEHTITAREETNLFFPINRRGSHHQVRGTYIHDLYISGFNSFEIFFNIVTLLLVIKQKLEVKLWR